jgi:tetratricopeptide (TPR) repeat protein
MTSAPSTHSDVAVGSDARGSWLYGPAIDLLLGAGVGYLVSIPLLLLWSGAAGVHAWPVALGAMFALLISGPHYGATILRVYERREDRRKYALFAVWVTLALCGLFVVGLNDVLVGSLLVTAYATWSPWHFSGQNYGLALMFLRRRGVVVERRAKRLLYGSFVLSCALAVLVLHGEAYRVATASVPVSAISVFQFMSLGLPQGFVRVAVPLTALAYLASLAGAAALLLRHARVRDLLPAACLVGVQALWFALPGALRVMANLPLEGLAFSVIWISAAHAVQYLWVTSYYARREDPSLRVVPYLGNALLAGSTVTLVPALVFAPAMFGSVPWDIGLAILLFSVVNLHHFILDGAIWKLRDGRVARLLLRDAPTEAGEPVAGSRSAWLRPAISVLGLASLGVAGLDLWEREFVINRAGTDADKGLRASQRLAWIGRDSPLLHTQLGDLLASQGRLPAALDAYDRSLELYATAPAWIGLGRIRANQGRWPEASAAFTSAVALDPQNVTAQAFAGRAWLELGRPDLAKSNFERALELAPASQPVRELLRRAIAAESAGP